MNATEHYRFLEDGEIVSHFIQCLDSDALKTWETMECTDLIDHHHTFGQFIRNYYMMWHDANPFNGGKHPDDRSMDVMVSIWKRLNPNKVFSDYADLVEELVEEDEDVVCDCPSCTSMRAYQIP